MSHRPTDSAARAPALLRIAGLRLSFQGHAVLDGLDGRIARALKGTSRFGAELDSLSDFVDFGVAPALLLYLWSLHEIKGLGWFAVLVFVIAAALRLARFNVMIDDPSKPAWQADFFVGMPAPAGAVMVVGLGCEKLVSERLLPDAGAAGDGLRIFPSPVPGRDLYAAPWTPDPSLFGADGHVAPEFVWAALDCPSGLATNAWDDVGLILLGRLAADLRAPLPGEATYVASAWPVERDGRKLHTCSALFSATGELHAVARAVWIELAG